MAILKLNLVNSESVKICCTKLCDILHNLYWDLHLPILAKVLKFIAKILPLNGFYLFS